MSYCRKSSPDSDIYLIRTIYGHYECFCEPLESFICETPKEMFDHLMEHKEEGLKVPERALERLTRDIKEQEKVYIWAEGTWMRKVSDFLCKWIDKAKGIE